MSLKHGSLFSGVGGFDLAAEWMGWENMFHCEWNQFGQKVLKYYWPNAVSYDDICKTDFTIWNGRIDILTGGFPCQPYSMAGKRQGTEDARHLWPEMCRAIRECRPTWIVGENVPGLINWSGGLVFEQVCADLEGEGYEVQPIVLPASGVNAPHRRDRVWFAAYLSSQRINRINGDHYGQTGENRKRNDESHCIGPIRPTQNPNENGRGGDERKEESSIWRLGDIGPGDNERVRTYHAEIGVDGNSGSQQFQVRTPERNGTDTEKERTRLDDRIERSGNVGYATNTVSIGQSRKEHRQEERGRTTKESIPTDWTDWPTVAPLCTGNDGFSPDMDNVTFFKQLGIDNPRQPAISYAKWRNESIKAGGNAIVPQVAFQIFKVIEQMQHI